jgi:uncharacterized protein YbjT (DUF2867 family)
MTSQNRTIVICGASGKQAGAVLKSLLKSREWNIVALSRDPDGARAVALKQRGVEVRRADLQDRATLNQASRASTAFTA